MKGLLITIKGGEESAKKEIKDLIDVEGKILEEAVEFECEQEELLKLCIYSQSANRILLLDELDRLKQGMSFRVRADDSSKEKELGAEINKENKFKVDLDNPDVALYSHKGNVGIDLTDDITKRSFRIFTHRHTLKGTNAFILLSEAGYTGKETILDPFAKDGTIALEAAHKEQRMPVRFFDWKDMPFTKLFDYEKEIKPIKKQSKVYAVSKDLRDLTAMKKNAKIANVEFNKSKLDLDWLDTKFGKKEIDIVISYPPHLSKKQWKEFWYQMDFIAKKIVFLVDEDFDEEHFEDVKTLQVGKVKKKIVSWEN